MFQLQTRTNSFQTLTSPLLLRSHLGRREKQQKCKSKGCTCPTRAFRARAPIQCRASSGKKRRSAHSQGGSQTIWKERTRRSKARGPDSTNRSWRSLKTASTSTANSKAVAQPLGILRVLRGSHGKAKADWKYLGQEPMLQK